MTVEDPLESVNRDVLGYDIYQEGSPENIKPKEQPVIPAVKNEKPAKVVENAEEKVDEVVKEANIIDTAMETPLPDIAVGVVVGSVLMDKINNKALLDNVSNKQFGAVLGAIVGLGTYILRK